MNHTNIKWERTDNLLGWDTEEREVAYELEGVDSAGNIYYAVGTYVCGELEKIEDVEDATPRLANKTKSICKD